MGGPHLWHNYRSIEIILYYDKKDKWLATYVAKKLVASIASASGWIWIAIAIHDVCIRAHECNSTLSVMAVGTRKEQAEDMVLASKFDTSQRSVSWCCRKNVRRGISQ